ncbi:hypothetical protein VE00_08136 [Pseudogymnoascus sp. WSF 3629]|jgi:hypothetical protein|nr:hypothetical protein VE00_08136 [Pseudogymnoascus sp. WSF 3629]
MATAEVLTTTHAMHTPAVDPPTLALYPGGAIDSTTLAHYGATIDLPHAPVLIPGPATAHAPSAPTEAVAAPTTSLASLPTELHLLIFSSLDPIDSTCLGLTSRHFYTAYRTTHRVRVPLNQRRRGPNTLESAWEVLGPVTACRYCGIYRCELHMHIREFMPARYEYCAVRGVFGLKAKEGVEDRCFRSNPPKPMMCGRHWLPNIEVPAVEASKL